jgi:hypothetical protein
VKIKKINLTQKINGRKMKQIRLKTKMNTPFGVQEDASLEEFLDLGDIFDAGFIDTPIEELVAIQPDSIGNWVRTSLLKELHEPGIFETRNRIYVMLNAGRRKSVSPSYIDGRPSIVRSLKSYPRINKALINI